MKKKESTDADLIEAFMEYNDLYFGNRLRMPVRLSFTAMNGLGKTSRCRVAGKRRSRNDNFGIRISSKLRWSRRLWMGTLIHELVHLEQQLKYSCGPRGKKFNRRILELAVAGAFDGLW